MILASILLWILYKKSVLQSTKYKYCFLINMHLQFIKNKNAFVSPLHDSKQCSHKSRALLCMRPTQEAEILTGRNDYF